MTAYEYKMISATEFVPVKRLMTRLGIAWSLLMYVCWGGKNIRVMRKGTNTYIWLHGVD